MPEVFRLSKWLVKEGKLSFWRDRWLNEGPLMQLLPISERPNLLIKDCKLGSGWDVESLQRMVGVDRIDEVMWFLSKCQNRVDSLIRMDTWDEKFSSKSAWDCIRVRASPHRWSVWV